MIYMKEAYLMDDNRLSKEYLEFVKAVNSDWTLPDKDGDIVACDAPAEDYGLGRCHTPHKRKRRKNAVKAACDGGSFDAYRKE